VTAVTALNKPNQGSYIPVVTNIRDDVYTSLISRNLGVSIINIIIVLDVFDKVPEDKEMQNVLLQPPGDCQSYAVVIVFISWQPPSVTSRRGVLT
jgi:hypothetical protein